MVQMGGAPVCVEICVVVCAEDSYWARMIATTLDLQNPRCFPRVCVANLNPWFLIDLSFSAPFRCLMASIMTHCIYCVKVCLSKTKHHMAALCNSHTRRLSCSLYQSNKQQNVNKLRRRENFVFLLSSRLWQTISSSHCFVQLRGEGLESSGCRHVSVCLSRCLKRARFPRSLTAALSPKQCFPG